MQRPQEEKDSQVVSRCVYGAYVTQSRLSVAVLPKGKMPDPLANDPIARSIAGYLVKNVPNKIFNVSQCTINTDHEGR